LNLAILASLKASSKLANFSVCLPTPLVKKTYLGTNDLITNSSYYVKLYKNIFIEKEKNIYHKIF